MSTQVAFLRAINVGGHASVKMTDLRRAFAAAGCRDVRTLIQSGNVIFDPPARDWASVSRRIRARLRDLLGHEPDVLLRTVRDIERMVETEPFAGLEAGPGVKLYVAFLSHEPGDGKSLPRRSPREALEVVAMQGLEVFVVSRRKKNGFFGFPNNFIETELGVPATTRNWSTIKRIIELVRKETHAPRSRVVRRNRPGPGNRRHIPRRGRHPGADPARERVERRPPSR